MRVKFNHDVIRRLSSELMSALNRLRELATLPQDVFLADPHKIASVKYNFIVITCFQVELTGLSEL